jgi:spore coat polysaccharide biosynthesis protein SpsF (cytidylyltransferase family)
MKTAVLIQARSRSRRLPGKCFLPFPVIPVMQSTIIAATGNPLQSMVERVYLQVSRSGIPAYFVIPENDDDLSRHLSEKGIPFFTGPEEDVRERYRMAAASLGLDLIIRATADNPFTDPEHIVLTLNRMKEVRSDLFSYSGLPLGAAVEVFTRNALFQDIPGEKGMHREHVSLHIKHDPERFSVVHEESPVMMAWRRRTQYDGPLPRLTVDEQADYDTVYAVACRLRADSLTGLLDLFLAEPGLFEGNRDVEQLRFDRH